MSENTINSLNLDSLDLYDEHDFKNQSNHINQSSDNIPKLRFPEFSGQWEKKKLGEVATKINSGKTPLGGETVYTSKGILFIRSQNVNNDSLELENTTYISEEINDGMKNSIVMANDILLNITGASLGRSCVVPDDFSIGNVNQHVCIIRLDETNNPRFLQPIFSSTKGQNMFQSLQTGSGREGLNFESIKGIELSFPTLPEQTRIATFLTAVDSKLQALKKKKSLLEDYKKGMMQKLFSQRLRFKDENGKDFPDWEEKKLGAYLQSSKLKNINLKFNKSDVLSVSGEFGIVNQIEFQGRSFAGESVHNYGVVETGDIVYTKSPLKSNPYGIIKVNKGKAGIVSTLYAVYKCKNTLNGVFLDYYFQLDENTNGYLRPLVQKGSKNDMKINNERVLIDPVFFPSIKEQTRIANFLSAIDEKINHCQKQIENIEVWKKGLLQKMFV